MTNSAIYMTPALARWRRYTEIPLMALAVGSLPVLLIEIVHDQLPRSDRLFIDIVNLAVLIAFAADYVVELVLASNRRRFVRSEYLSLLVVVAQAIALFPSLAAFGILRALRGARAFRVVGLVARAAAIHGTAARDGRKVLRKHAASFAFAVAGLTWITSAAAFTVVEDVGVGRRVHSFFDALWWSIGTMSTAGSGDVYPITAAGRVISGFTMIVGISTFALVTAKIAQFLIRAESD